MKKILFFAFLILTSCDTAPKWPDTEKCMKHRWISGLYKFKFVKGSSIYMKNLETGKEYQASIFENGWSEVKCP